VEDRAPLIEGLPTLTFIENQGQEIQNPRSKSYTNPAEIKLVVTIIQRLLYLNIPETSIGVISLCKFRVMLSQSDHFLEFQTDR
jgi:superfamily I DNA and/or RNA helicase